MSHASSADSRSPLPQPHQPHQSYSSLFYNPLTAAAAAAASTSWELQTAAAYSQGQQHMHLHQEHQQQHQQMQLHQEHQQQHRHMQHHQSGRSSSLNRNPFDPQSRIPLPHPFGEYMHFGCESSFIRRRNERERERVRFVNEGYEKLKDTLPIENKDKRISKVEILKSAIRYIQHMENMLRAADQQAAAAASSADSHQHQRQHRSDAGNSSSRKRLHDHQQVQQPMQQLLESSTPAGKRRPLSEELQQGSPEKKLRHC